jgi:hypothetical protein
MELFEAIHTALAMRRLKPDPVPQELINCILDAPVILIPCLRPRPVPPREARSSVCPRMWTLSA